MITTASVDETIIARAAGVEFDPAWIALRDAAASLHPLQARDGSVPDAADHPAARAAVETIIDSIATLAPGTSVKLDVFHKGESKTVTLALGELPNERQAKADQGKADQGQGGAFTHACPPVK